MPTLLAAPLAMLAMMLVLATLPVSLPLVGLVIARDRRRLRDAANRTRCMRCGAPLGPEALDTAETAYRAETNGRPF